MADLLGGIKKWGGNLLEAMHDYGTMEYRPPSLPGAEELAGQDAAGLQELYDRQFRVARNNAIYNQGAQWFNMDDYGHVGATPGYVTGLQNAITNATTLRDRRMDDERRTRLAQHINKLAGLEPDDPDYLSPADRDFLLATDPKTQSEVLQKHQFPVLSQGAVAGTLQMIPGNDGFWYRVPKDGSDPVKTTVPVQDPSAWRTDALRMQDPDYLQYQQQVAHRKEYGKQEGQALAEAQQSAPAAYQSTDNAIRRLESIKARLQELPTGRIEGPARVWFDSEMQAVEAELNDIALRNIANLADAGVRLNPITEAELALLMSVSANVQNLPEANIRIIDDTIARLLRQRDQTYEFLTFIDNPTSRILEWRPRSYVDRQTEESKGVQQPPPPGTIPVGSGED